MVVLYISCAVDPQSNTPLTHIPLRAILGVLQIGIRAKAIENQVKNVLLDYNHFQNIALVQKGLHGTFMHILFAALVDTIMSDSEDSTVTYTTVSYPYEGRSGDVSPRVDGLLDPEDDNDEDLKEDPADYPADHDEEEEPSGDDADEEDEEQDEDDDDEEEEHPASADSIPPPPALRVTTRISFRPHPPTLSFTKEDAERFLAMPIPPPSLLTLLSSLLPQISSPPLPASPPILPIPLPAASPPLQLSIVHCPGYEAGESLVAATARPIEGRRADYGFVNSIEAEIRRRIAEDIRYGIRHTWIDPRDVAKEEALTTLEGSTLG
nr:hypothetical protein [Tanacetum cinerariifolium]